MGCEGCKNPECYLTQDPNYCYAETLRRQATTQQLRNCVRSMHVLKIQASQTASEPSPKSPLTLIRDRTRTPAAKAEPLQQRQWQRTKHQN
jgi:hypothetical protein